MVSVTVRYGDGGSAGATKLTVSVVACETWTEGGETCSVPGSAGAKLADTPAAGHASAGPEASAGATGQEPPPAPTGSQRCHDRAEPEPRPPPPHAVSLPVS